MTRNEDGLQVLFRCSGVRTYTVCEEIAVKLWRTDADCVRELKTLEVMPWASRAVVLLSDALSPVLITLVAYLWPRGELLGHIWQWLAALSWAAYAVQLVSYARGHFARMRGVPPSQPGKRPDLKREKWFVGVSLVAALLMCLAWISVHLRAQSDKYILGSPLLAMITAMGIQQLSTYTRHRFWNADFEEAVQQSELHQRP
jgi:hypothetical protein